MHIVPTTAHASKGAMQTRAGSGDSQGLMDEPCVTRQWQALLCHGLHHDSDQNTCRLGHSVQSERAVKSHVAAMNMHTVGG
jgi:hypothetical protein